MKQSAELTLAVVKLPQASAEAAYLPHVLRARRD